MTPKLFALLTGFIAVASFGFVMLIRAGKKIDREIKEMEKKNYNGDVDWLLELDEHEKHLS